MNGSTVPFAWVPTEIAGQSVIVLTCVISAGIVTCRWRQSHLSPLADNFLKILPHTASSSECVGPPQCYIDQPSTDCRSETLHGSTALHLWGLAESPSCESQQTLKQVVDGF